MEHFSHDHPLILKHAPKADEGEVLCFCCSGEITQKELAYGCAQCKEYFLHKVCVELPLQIRHPKHDEHILILLTKSPYDEGGADCDVCDQSIYGFTYHCSLCQFDLDITCALQSSDIFSDSTNRNIKHEGHVHSLTLCSRPALFPCDACGVEDRDLTYLCPTCPFLIHRSCASSSVTLHHEDHPHPLTLAYGLPSDIPEFRYSCDICRGSILPNYWAYCCVPCRYFVHLKCMMQKIDRNSGAEYDDDANFEKNFLKILIDDDLVRLPAADKSKELIRSFLLRKNSLAPIQPEIRHFGHEQHPLILFHELNDNDIEEDEGILCNCCIEPISSTHKGEIPSPPGPPPPSPKPISAPYYACVKCSYFLHISCAKLPNTLKHRSHSHPLSLFSSKKFYDIFSCNLCNGDSNGFFFNCETCDFFLDVKCAVFPTSFVHQSHDHPLFECEASDKYCNACRDKKTIEGLGFGCQSCKFNLHYKCAMLPQTIRQRWEDHRLTLSFPPYYYHPDEFYCKICEKKMHSKFWIYHCGECDNSCHPFCAPKLGRFPNVKFGGILEVNSHTHPLRFKRKATVKSSCHSCRVDLDRVVFECEFCTFCLCVKCVRKMS